MVGLVPFKKERDTRSLISLGLSLNQRQVMWVHSKKEASVSCGKDPHQEPNTLILDFPAPTPVRKCPLLFGCPAYGVCYSSRSWLRHICCTYSPPTRLCCHALLPFCWWRRAASAESEADPSVVHQASFPTLFIFLGGVWDVFPFPPSWFT